jgi:hypothetical protein
VPFGVIGGLAPGYTLPRPRAPSKPNSGRMMVPGDDFATMKAGSTANLEGEPSAFFRRCSATLSGGGRVRRHVRAVRARSDGGAPQP